MPKTDSPSREPLFMKAVLDPECPWCHEPNDTQGILCSGCRDFMNRRAEQLSVQPPDESMFHGRIAV